MHLLQQLLFTMEMEVAKELPLNRMKDESTTSYSRELDFSTTSYCRPKDESTYSRELDIFATSSSRMQGLQQVAHLRALPSS